jgi:hypothetical protein
VLRRIQSQVNVWTNQYKHFWMYYFKYKKLKFCCLQPTDTVEVNPNIEADRKLLSPRRRDTLASLP